MKTNDKIENYLNEQLKGKKLVDFEAQIPQDKELDSELLFHKEINESIVDDEVYYLRQKLSLIIEKASTKAPLVKTISSIAAGIIILLSIIHITNTPNTDTAFAKFYTPYQADLSSRSTNNEIRDLNFALKLYADADYETSYEILNNYNKDNFNNTVANYYLGLCAIELNKNFEAAQSFEAIIADGDYAYTLHAKWYLGMLYLKTNKFDKAKILFEELAENSNFYSEKSGKILKKYF